MAPRDPTYPPHSVSAKEIEAVLVAIKDKPRLRRLRHLQLYKCRTRTEKKTKRNLWRFLCDACQMFQGTNCVQHLHLSYVTKAAVHDFLWMYLVVMPLRMKILRSLTDIQFVSILASKVWMWSNNATSGVCGVNLLLRALRWLLP